MLDPAPDFVVQAVTWSRLGDNYYDGSLGWTEIRDPERGDAKWRWFGAVPLPPPAFPGGPTGARFVGVQIRGLAYEAYESSPQHMYCWIEALGLGVRDCGEWIDAILQQLVLCRGLVGEIIDCHGLNWALAPRILIGGLGTRDPWPGAAVAGEQQRTPFTFLTVAGLTFLYDAEQGWSYAENVRSPQPMQYRGPFRDAEEAARDFVATLGEKYGTVAPLAQGLDMPHEAMRSVFADMDPFLRAIDAAMDVRRQAK